MKSFQDFNITPPTSVNAEGDGYTLCPKCSHTRKHSTAKCLSVNTEKAVWNCHHCSYKGTLKGGDTPGKKVYVRPKWDTVAPGQEINNWFKARHIPESIVVQESIMEVSAYMPQCEDFVPCLAFPYYKSGQVVNVKYRAVKEKAFRQVADAEKVWYRQDSIARDCVVICEGEIDVLSCLVAGFTSAISVPDGAPSPKAKQYTSKFTFLDQDPDPLEGVEMIILAVDNDAPGIILREELARRLGRERCYTVTWPDGSKDANDVLIRHGAPALRRCLVDAAPWPVQDAVTVETLAPEIMRLAIEGLPRGLSTGWGALDRVFTIAPGQVTIVTGIPSHGKSQFVDALAVNLMQLHGWRFVICSPEHYPTALHGVKLLEKWANRTVRRHAPHLEAQVITHEETVVALAEMHESLTFIAPDECLTILALLSRVEAFVRRRGVQGLIIDPWNEFDHTRDRHTTDAEYINLTLGLVRRWARKWSVHVFIVAHPTKMQKMDDGNYPVPTPYDINGGAAWRNKSDNCLAVWRTMQPDDFNVDIHTQKVKWSNLGSMGECITLQFNQWTSRYSGV